MSPREAAELDVAFVGSYVPRRCGIATFTADTVAAVRARDQRVGDRREHVAFVDRYLPQRDIVDHLAATDVLGCRWSGPPALRTSSHSTSAGRALSFYMAGRRVSPAVGRNALRACSARRVEYSSRRAWTRPWMEPGG